MLFFSASLFTSLASPGYCPRVIKAIVASIAIIVTTIISSTRVNQNLFFDKQEFTPPVFWLKIKIFHIFYN